MAEEGRVRAPQNRPDRRRGKSKKPVLRPGQGGTTVAKIVAVANQKGGVGKTTTAVNLSSCVAALGKKVLIVDLDPQGNTTSGYGVSKRSVDVGVYDLLLGRAQARDALRKTPFRVDLIPANTQLAGAALELVDIPNRESCLRRALAPITDSYDFIFIDCPPSLDLLTLNGLCACDTVLIPLQCEYFALEGISKLLNTIKIIKSKLNPKLEIEGFLLTMYDSRLRLANQIYDEVKRHFQELVFKTVIQRNVKLSESPSHGLPVILYDADSTGSKNHLALAKEIINKN